MGALHSGKRVGAYLLKEEIGSGSYGSVWRATAGDDAKYFALKFSSFSARASIEKEARLWMEASDHPNVAPFLGSFPHEGKPVLVTNYVEPGSLAKWLIDAHTGVPPHQTTVQLMMGVVDGLNHLHGKAIVHRDVKPENVVLKGEVPLLIDFGISRALNVPGGTHNPLGTTAYMAPEALSGDRSAATDVWAAGVMLHLMVAGELPFPQTGVELERAIREDGPANLPPGTDPLLVRIIGRALQKNVNARYPSANAMWLELYDWMRRAQTLVLTPAPQSPIHSASLPIAISAPSGEINGILRTPPPGDDAMNDSNAHSRSDAAAEPTLRFKDHGVAYAHLTLPAGHYEFEAKKLEQAVAKADPPVPLTDAHISFLTGQSDVMLELRLRDFRSAVQLDYRSEAMGANWLFLVPYEQLDTSVTRLPPSEGLALNFVVHLRYQRDAFRSNGQSGLAFEREAVDFLQRAAAHKGLNCEARACFGWSDLVAAGTFTNKKSLHDFVVELETFKFAGKLVARRVLTLISYDRTADLIESPMTVRPLLFVRALPTHIRQAAHAMSEALPSGKWRTFSIDGKWDLVIVSENEVPIHEYLQKHREAAVSGAKLSDKGVERLESHLMADEHTPVEEAFLDLPECSCRRRFDRHTDWAPIIAAGDISSELLPRALRRAIMNVVDLFRAASSDATNCCDIVPSLLRCAAAGRRLVSRYRHLKRHLDSFVGTDADVAEVVKWSAILARAREELEDWCTYAERAVSQRTVGRFEEFLAQNERVVSYRGGIQKMLYIADSLTNAYAGPILTSDESTFVTLYDPVDTVVAMRRAGFIRVPVRYLFFLPLAITHLWHEVGVHAFFSNYAIPFDKRTMRRVAAFGDLSEIPSRHDVVSVHVEVAEMYGDLITLHFGFRESIDDSVLALASAMLEQVGYNSATETAKEVFLLYLLNRLYLMVEFKLRRKLIADAIKERPLQCDRDTLDSWRPSAKIVRTALAHLAGTLNRELLSHARYADEPGIINELFLSAGQNFANLVENITSGLADISVAHRPYMTDLAWKLPDVTAEPPEAAAVFGAIQEGHVVSLQLGSGRRIDPNSLYQRLQRMMIEKLRNKKRASAGEETFLMSTAALMRTVLLSFYEQTPETLETAESEKFGDLLRYARDFAEAKMPDLEFTPAWLKPAVGSIE